MNTPRRHGVQVRRFALAAAVLAGCTDRQPAPQPAVPSYTAKYIASKKFRGDDGPFQAMAQSCEAWIQAHRPCGGKEADLYGPNRRSTANTAESAQCLASIRKLAPCATLTEANEILLTITAQRVTGEKNGRAMWGKNFVELEE